MGGMFPESGKNIYISDTSYGYTEIDMINLFGSPAGRAINKITSIKLNKSEAAKAKAKSKDRTNTNGISCSSGSGGGGSSSSSSSSSSSYSQSNDANSNDNTTSTNSMNRDHTLFVEDQKNSIKAISGTVGIDTTFGIGVGINNGTAQTIHRHCIAKPDKYMNLHKKKVKCWESFLENDKLNNNWSCTSTDDTKVERFDELITDAEIYEEAVRFLGLSCTLSNSCRCLECQSRYFDYEDDEDYDDSDDDDDDDFITVF
ncbi:uncharacterized protein LOC116338424 isoform X2 [Contarinia nasturtii]|nr:uncharacterized protein LOC116338424 isoform X2 [Contarinia nasturtii]